MQPESDGMCRSAGRTNEILGRLQRRKAAAGAQAVARERKVSLMRKYRTGELPDVQQLSIAAFLGPLGMPSIHTCAVSSHSSSSCLLSSSLAQQCWE